MPEAVGQAAETRLLLWAGEWFLNVEEGTPYFVGVLGKHSQATADATLQDRISGTQGFVDMQNYVSTIDPDNRHMEVSTDLDTIYGPTTLQVSNYRNF